MSNRPTDGAAVGGSGESTRRDRHGLVGARRERALPHRLANRDVLGLQRTRRLWSARERMIRRAATRRQRRVSDAKRDILSGRGGWSDTP